MSNSLCLYDRVSKIPSLQTYVESTKKKLSDVSSTIGFDLKVYHQVDPFLDESLSVIHNRLKCRNTKVLDPEVKERPTVDLPWESRISDGRQVYLLLRDNVFNTGTRSWSPHTEDNPERSLWSIVNRCRLWRLW